MAFWGCEIEPGHPHKVIPAGGIGSQLHVSQATLGIKVKPKERILLSAQVTDGPSVLLCSLTAGSVESCSLDLIFDEEVVFTVEGPTSIHLSGYYMPTMVEEEEEEDEDEDEDYDDDVEFGDEGDEDDEEEEEEFLQRGHNNSGVLIEEITEEEAQVAKGSKGGVAPVPVVTEANGKTKKKKEKGGEGAEQGKVEEDEDGFLVAGAAKKVEVAAKKVEVAAKKVEVAAKKVEAAAGSKKRASEPAVGTERVVKKTKGEASEAPARVAAPVSKAAEATEPVLSKKERKALKKSEGPEESGAKKGGPVVRSFPNGLQVEEVKLGDPAGKQAKNGKKVVMHYTGKLKGGKVFDSTVGKRPFEFRLGMRVGDKRKLTIPPAMGYGAKGAPPQIPGNAQLMFDIELVNVK